MKPSFNPKINETLVNNGKPRYHGDDAPKLQASMTITKIQLNPDQRKLMRYLLEYCIEQHEISIVNNDYTESGILKAINDIQNASMIIEKLNFDILK